MNGLIPWARVLGNHTGAAPLELTWYYIEFDSDLRNFHRGEELWGERRIKIRGWSFLKEKV